MKNPFSVWTSSVCLLMAISGCAVMDHAPSQVFDQEETLALLPMVNYTETPQAGRRAEGITEVLLYSRGLYNLQRYPAQLLQKTSPFASDEQLLEEAIQWAKTQQFRYALTGTVDEWRYKVGIDGEPAVGVSFRLIDLKADTVVWSAVGGQSGWSREAVSAVAQKLIKKLLAKVKFL